MRKVVVFGASGKVGSRIIVRLLEKDIQVTAFVHGEHAFAPNPHLTIFKGNIYSADDVRAALSGADAVVSALGSWGTPKKDILSSGMQNIIPAMQASGIKKIVSVTGADARAPGDKPDLMHKLTHSFFGVVANKILEDGEKHITLLAGSKLDWTVLRSPVMNESGTSGSYVLRETLPSLTATIHRDDVASAMVDLLESDQYVRRAPVIYRS